MCLTLHEKRSVCSLILEDGTILQGKSFGAAVNSDGEVGRFLLDYF